MRGSIYNTLEKQAATGTRSHFFRALNFYRMTSAGGDAEVLAGLRRKTISLLRGGSATASAAVLHARAALDFQEQQ